MQGRTVLVTGANGGIGSCFVEALVERGAAKIYAGIRDVGSVPALQARFGPVVAHVPIDLADGCSIDAAIPKLHGVDLVISNAGRTLVGPFLAQSDQDIRGLFEVNTFGPLRLIRSLLAGLIEHHGGVICVASMAALIPALQAEAYSASKAALMMLLHGIRTATKAAGLRVALVYPGFVDTPMSGSFQVAKASPRQVAERALDGWLAGETSIFPDVFAQMTRDALLHRMPEWLEDPNGLLVRLVDEFVVREDAGQ